MKLDEKARRMAELIREIEETNRAKREANKEFKEQLTALWKELEKLGFDVRDGQRSIGDEE